CRGRDVNGPDRRYRRRRRVDDVCNRRNDCPRLRTQRVLRPRRGPAGRMLEGRAPLGRGVGGGARGDGGRMGPRGGGRSGGGKRTKGGWKPRQAASSALRANGRLSAAWSPR